MPSSSTVRAGLVLLLLTAWIVVGARDTASFLLVADARPAEPPALGRPLADWGGDVGRVHALLDGRPVERVVLRIGRGGAPPLYLRYQLAHLLYPVEVYARPEEGADAVVTGPGVPGPVGWRAEATRDGFTLWRPE